MAVKKNVQCSIVVKVQMGTTTTGKASYSSRSFGDINKGDINNKEQRKLSRRQKDSSNREKQRRHVAVLHEKTANQHRDFLHKKARCPVDRYDAVGIEDISVKAMAKHKKGRKFSFGKSVADNGWNMFVSLLEYKLAWQGKYLVKIDKWYPSSRRCHVCGYTTDKTKDLSVKEWDCPNCGTHHNRDKNAAINIREEAKRILLSS